MEKTLAERLPRYTDMPIEAQLWVEDIDSFSKVRDVNPAAVASRLAAGRLEVLEDEIQLGLEQILDHPTHAKDWGGEGHDLYTSNLIVQGTRIATAFLLKGRGCKSKNLQVGDCGKNGDQLVRLFEAPAKLFVVQFVGPISENVIKDVQGKVAARRGSGNEAWFCLVDGQDTARLLRAYGKL